MVPTLKVPGRALRALPGARRCPGRLGRVFGHVSRLSDHARSAPDCRCARLGSAHDRRPGRLTGRAGHPATRVDGVEVLGAISPSRAADFMTCPLMFRFRTVDRLPEPFSVDAVRGTLVHKVLEDLFSLPAADRTPEGARDMLVPTWERFVEEDPTLAAMFDGAEAAHAARLPGVAALRARGSRPILHPRGPSPPRARRARAVRRDPARLQAAAARLRRPARRRARRARSEWWTTRAWRSTPRCPRPTVGRRWARSRSATS